MKPISGQAGPGAVALAERPGGRHEIARGDRLAAPGGIGDNEAERTGSVVDRDPEAVGQGRRSLGDDACDRDPKTLERLRCTTGRAADGIRHGGVARHRDRAG